MVTLIQLVIAFLVIALIAGFFGFYSVEHTAVGFAKILFFIFVVLFILSLLGVFFYQ